ncbi:DUF2922 domain-containing protein [Bacillus sp. FSL K6-3431]|uniref:DUF2922 domain-containing protein n=1 Tax=Bacillus sp. FSL K6-3431 TaxID=2921500 RepID=UPI0030F80A7F
MKTLELIFETAEGKIARMSIENPQEPVDSNQVKTALENIIASNTFIDSDGHAYESYKGARLVERSVTEIEII